MFFHDESQDTNNHCIRRVDLANGATTTLAGDGVRGFADTVPGATNGAFARFAVPRLVVIDPSGTYALVAVRAWPA